MNRKLALLACLVPLVFQAGGTIVMAQPVPTYEPHFSRPREYVGGVNERLSSATFLASRNRMLARVPTLTAAQTTSHRAASSVVLGLAIGMIAEGAIEEMWADETENGPSWMQVIAHGAQDAGDTSIDWLGNQVYEWFFSEEYYTISRAATSDAGMYGAYYRHKTGTGNYGCFAPSMVDLLACHNQGGDLYRLENAQLVRISDGYPQAILIQTYASQTPASCAGRRAGWYGVNGVQSTVYSCDAVLANQQVNPFDAAATVPTDYLSQPVSTSVMTDFANWVWKEASEQPGYDGVAYDPLDPITEADMEAVRQDSPTTWPSINDLVSPAYEGSIASNPSPNPWPNPDPVPEPTPEPNPGTDPNPYPDPQTLPEGSGSVTVDQLSGLPSLEGATPTMDSILDPLLGLFPGLRALEIDGPQGQCPGDVIELAYGLEFDMGAYCPIIEQFRALFSGIMVFFFTLGALVRFLTA